MVSNNYWHQDCDKMEKTLRDLVRAADALRNTAVVDDEFPRMMHIFDSALRAASEFLSKRDHF